MGFFEIFNKILLELNYRSVSRFEDIFKSEHKRILENINLTNAEVCAAFDWSFLEKSTDIEVLAGQNEATEGVDGKIIKIFDKNTRLAFCPDYERFLGGFAPENAYSCFNDRIFFAPKGVKRKLTVYYISSMYAKTPEGKDIARMEGGEDYTVMPMPWGEQVLLYGTCLKTKANVSYPKFPFWNTMYVAALASMRSKCGLTSEDAPMLTIKKQQQRVF